MKYILGSSSKYRRMAFAKVAPDFETMSPDIDEKAIRDGDPKALTIKLAKAKAAALLPRIKEPVILVTGDQVVSFKGQIREKPTSLEQAREFLNSYSGESVEVINGTAVTNTKTGKQAIENDVVTIRFKPFPEGFVEKLIQATEPMLCGGGLRGEHPLFAPYIESRDGTDESLQGVPVELIKRLVQKVGGDKHSGV